MGDFDQQLIERCGEAVKKHSGKCGFILLLVKSKEDPQMLAATNLVTEVALKTLSSGFSYLQQLDVDVRAVVDKMRSEGGVDGRSLGDGN
jgi:hypothetical protein